MAMMPSLLPDSAHFFEPDTSMDNVGPDERAPMTDSMPFTLSNRMGPPGSSSVIVGGNQPRNGTGNSQHAGMRSDRSSVQSETGGEREGLPLYRPVQYATPPMANTTPAVHETPDKTSQVASPTRADSPPLSDKKMHQTSTRIMKVTPEGRPFTRDFKDLFATLVVSMELRTHRVRFKSYPFSFSTEVAVGNLSNLKFAQSNRMPDPGDSTRIVTTTTTTTFSMAPDMAKALCQRFLDAHLFEPVSDKSLVLFKDKCIWGITAKGLRIIDRFTNRNGIHTDMVVSLRGLPENKMQLVILERDTDTDAILESDELVEIVFRRFVGKSPNIRPASETETTYEYATGTVGVRLVDLRKMQDGNLKWTFTGKSMQNWILECSTALEPEEAMELARMFLFHQLILYVGDTRGNRGQESGISGSKHAIYQVTAKGRRIAGWDGTYDVERASPPRQVSSVSQATAGMTTMRFSNPRNGSQSAVHANGSNMDHASTVAALLGSSSTNNRETNTARLHIILDNAALRNQFHEFLRLNVSEENLNFYLDVVEFERLFKEVTELESVSEGLARAYSIYNAFLANGAPSELNLDHSLRLDMAAQMTRVVGDDVDSMRKSLLQVSELYERASKQVFRLMASDSVPKFLKTPYFLDTWGTETAIKKLIAS